jgi:heme-degrading monooxygenase HmoA
VALNLIKFGRWYYLWWKKGNLACSKRGQKEKEEEEEAVKARMTTCQAKDGKLGELVEIVEKSVRAAISEQPGYKAFHTLADPSTGKLIGISFWETEEDLKASETSGYYQEQMDKMADIMADIIDSASRDVFDVHDNV